jgi:hypothetical protein
MMAPRARSPLVIEDFPDDLYAQLEERARAEQTSVGLLVVSLVERALRLAIPLSIMELEDLGPEIWQDHDAADFIDRERASWD